MAGAVLHEGQQLAAGALGAAQVAVHGVAEEVEQVEVLPLVVAADAVGLAGGALRDDGLDGGAVVLDVEPIPHVLPVAIDRDGLALGHAGDGQGDELLGMLAGAVVVRAVRRQRGQAVGVVVSPHQVVAAGLAGAVGTVRRVGHFFMKLPRLAQGAVHLIRGDVQEPGGLVSRPHLAGGVQQGEGAHHVGLDEGRGARDAVVHVALGGKVHQLAHPVPVQQVDHQLPVLDVALHQLDALQARNLLGIRGVGELVQDQDVVIGVGAVPPMDEVRADEPGAAGDEDGFRHGGTPEKKEKDGNRR